MVKNHGNLKLSTEEWIKDLKKNWKLDSEIPTRNTLGASWITRGKNLNHELSEHIIRKTDVSHKSDIIMCELKTHTAENCNLENSQLEQL